MQVEFVLHVRLTVIPEQDQSSQRVQTVEVDRHLITVALYHEAPHQHGLISQHRALPMAHIFKRHRFTLREIHIHYL